MTLGSSKLALAAAADDQKNALSCEPLHSKLKSLMPRVALPFSLHVARCSTTQSNLVNGFQSAPCDMSLRTKESEDLHGTHTDV